MRIPASEVTGLIRNQQFTDPLLGAAAWNAPMSPARRIPQPFKHPFTPTDVHAAGLTVAALRGWLQRNEVALIAPGLYCPAELAQSDDIRTIWSTRAVAEGRNAVSAHAAALIHELPTPTRLDASARRPISVKDLPSDALETRGKLLVPTPEWTAVLLGRGQRMPQALIPLDAAIRAGASLSAMQEHLAFMQRWPGVRFIGRALAEVDGASESPLESVSRGIFIEAKLPKPVLQARMQCEGATYFADFFWPEFGLIGEADGIGKYGNNDVTTAHTVAAEKRRQAALERAGYRVIRWLWSDVEPDPRRLIQRLQPLLVSAR